MKPTWVLCTGAKEGRLKPACTQPGFPSCGVIWWEPTGIAGGNSLPLSTQVSLSLSGGGIVGGGMLGKLAWRVNGTVGGNLFAFSAQEIRCSAGIGGVVGVLMVLQYRRNNLSEGHLKGFKNGERRSELALNTGPHEPIRPPLRPMGVPLRIQNPIACPAVWACSVRTNWCEGTAIQLKRELVYEADGGSKTKIIPLYENSVDPREKWTLYIGTEHGFTAVPSPINSDPSRLIASKVTAEFKGEVLMDTVFASTVQLDIVLRKVLHVPVDHYNMDWIHSVLKELMELCAIEDMPKRYTELYAQMIQTNGDAAGNTLAISLRRLHVKLQAKEKDESKRRKKIAFASRYPTNHSRGVNGGSASRGVGE
ncbi:hypothetical protein HHX47_DHR7000386 [Lentinula edodes]|nr:hypothetical protein HHX47_DHR7000386 [Lentinula edodes]